MSEIYSLEDYRREKDTKGAAVEIGSSSDREDFPATLTVSKGGASWKLYFKSKAHIPDWISSPAMTDDMNLGKVLVTMHSDPEKKNPDLTWDQVRRIISSKFPNPPQTGGKKKSRKAA